ncbi:MAG: sigma-70 family RNA polymerase sigma factor [Phycisphaera sp.]|nr:MAG: sigma-70 family RNA polymerase sigma factor [Phycisphaera sp.]
MDESASNQPPPESPPAGPIGEVTLLISQSQTGDTQAADKLLDLVYEQLRATASSYFRAQSADHTLQPTALVHEAYLKLVGDPDRRWESRGHFCAVAATAMRQILQDHAKSKRAAKRGGPDSKREPLTSIESPSGTSPVDLVQLDDLLTALAETDERGSRIVEMRYFGGLTNAEIAALLDVSERTIERTWRRCRAWILAEIAAADPSA